MKNVSDLLNKLEAECKTEQEAIIRLHQNELQSLRKNLSVVTKNLLDTIQADIKKEVAATSTSLAQLYSLKGLYSALLLSLVSISILGSLWGISAYLGDQIISQRQELAQLQDSLSRMPAIITYQQKNYAATPDPKDTLINQETGQQYVRIQFAK